LIGQWQQAQHRKQLMKSKLLLSTLLALSGLAASGLAAAAPIVYEFSGTVASDSAERGWQQFAGSFSFDSASVDGIADPSTGAYAHAGAPWGISVSFDGGAALLLNSSFNVLVSNDLAGQDQWGLLARNASGSQVFSLTLSDYSATVFGSDALPLSGLTLADFGYGSFGYESAAGELQGWVGALQCVAGCGAGVPPAAVPEPGGLALAGLGLATLLGRRRLQRAD
jgi:hypothetical protein